MDLVSPPKKNFSKIIVLIIVTWLPSSRAAPPVIVNPSGQINDLVIAAGQIRSITGNLNVKKLTINGTLKCDANTPVSTVIRAETIEVNGVLECGNDLAPFTKKIIFSLKPNSSVSPANQPWELDMNYRGVIVMPGGLLRLRGDASKSGWFRLGQTLNSGAQTIQLKQNNSASVPTLSIGDSVVIGPTGYDPMEAETFTITGILSTTPLTATLDHPARYLHWGNFMQLRTADHGLVTVDERAEVAILNRSVVVRADEVDGVVSEDATDPQGQLGGHIMVHEGGQAFIDSVELYKMGQAGKLARYPFHWHQMGDVSGQYIRNSSIHHSFQRCVTVHGTNGALVENNVCFDFRGHGYFLEDGNETNNRIVSNLAIGALAPSASRAILQSDNFALLGSSDRNPAVAGFWISNPKNTIINNVVSGSVGTGFWMSFADDSVDVRDIQGNRTFPRKENTLAFTNNSARGCAVGFSWDGGVGALANNPLNPNDRAIIQVEYAPAQIPIFSGLQAIKNLRAGIYFRGTSAIFQKGVLADNGWSAWMAYNQIFKDTIFIGKTNNTSIAIETDYQNRSNRPNRAGVVLYDGPFEIRTSEFLAFSTQAENFNNNGTTVDITTYPFIATGGNNKLTNIVSGLRFNPEPLHRLFLRVFDGTYGTGNSNDIEAMQVNSVRDLDGTLSGLGRDVILAGNRSLSIPSPEPCVSLEPRIVNLKACPVSASPMMITFSYYVPGGISNNTPFIVKRSDGKQTHNPQEISAFLRYQANLNHMFAVDSHAQYTYDLYTPLRFQNTRIFMSATSYATDAIPPIIRVNRYGKNCALGLPGDAVEVSSISDLNRQTTTSFLRGFDTLSVRIFPNRLWPKIVSGPEVTANAGYSGDYPIICDSVALPAQIVKGALPIAQVQTSLYTPYNRKLVVWACDANNPYNLWWDFRLTQPISINSTTTRAIPLVDGGLPLCLSPENMMRCGASSEIYCKSLAFYNERVDHSLPLIVESAVHGETSPTFSEIFRFNPPNYELDTNPTVFTNFSD